MADRKKALNRTSFLQQVADRTGAHRRDVEHVWENALAVIRDAVKSGTDVSITGFGKFKQKVSKAVPAGTRKDPFTGEMRKFPARPKKIAPRFTPAKQFKEYVSGSLRSLPAVNTRPMALGGGTTTSARGGSTTGGAKASRGGAKKTASKATKGARGAKRTTGARSTRGAAKRR